MSKKSDFYGTKLYIEPWNCGLSSTARATGSRLGRLLTTLADEINRHIVKGEITSDIEKLRLKIHAKLEAEGWRISCPNNRWKVLPPLDREQFSKKARAEA